MKKLYFLIFIGSLFACNQVKKKVPTGQGLFKDDPAQWISDGRPLPGSDSLFYMAHPAPLFRKEFNVKQTIDSATLYITAAGYYLASLNGNPIGNNVLDPAWTDYSKRIYYSTYNVKDLIQSGENCLGVSLGNGFYNPLPLRKWGRRNLRNDLQIGKPKFLAKLVIYYENGTVEDIFSNNSWKYAYGPIVKNSVYIGVTYDARKEIGGWNTSGFNDQKWEYAVHGDSPGGQLQKAFFPPVQIIERMAPDSIYSPEEGMYIVDMGVNFTGTYRIKLSGVAGDTVTFRFGERIYDDGTLNPMTSVIGQIKRKGMGGPGAPDIAWQTDSYIINVEDEAWFSPAFTYHVFRYMEIVGLDHKPKISDIEGLVINSNLVNKNQFSCSSDLLNSIQKATERTFLANLVSVQSDCPAREKFGYGGDINATSESFIYNFDMQSFYRKTIYDWVDAMNDSVFVDTAPYVGIKYCGISWESAFLITQYYLYLYYNDTELIKELYDLDLKWMDKVARIHPEGLVEVGLSDHESLEPVPVELTGTCHYLQCAKIMKSFASVMGDKASEEKYDQLARKLKGLVKARFWDRPVKEKINRQTLFSTLLYHGIVPDNQIEAAKDSLINAVRNGPSGHFNTGIFGTKYILETLSEYVSPQQVYEIVNSTQYPGWGHMIDRGATTIWETWKESDNTYSNCHPMFGTVTEWYYRWLAGIRPIPTNPGFKEFVLAPSLPEDLDSLHCVYHSAFGPIVSNWEKVGKGSVRYTINIPQGSLAHVNLEIGKSSKISIVKDGKTVDPSKIMGLPTGNFKLAEGDYDIAVSDN
jgi:alpha-L-rhamnosidase